MYFCPMTVARIDWGGAGPPKVDLWTQVDFLNLTPPPFSCKKKNNSKLWIKQNKTKQNHFWPILWLKVDLLADLTGPWLRACPVHCWSEWFYRSSVFKVWTSNYGGHFGWWWYWEVPSMQIRIITFIPLLSTLLDVR